MSGHSVCRFTITHNVLQLPEGGDFEVLRIQLSRKLIEAQSPI